MQNMQKDDFCKKIICEVNMARWNGDKLLEC